MAKLVVRVVAAVIEFEGRYLITQRKGNAVLPLMWEFPGGKVEEGESDADALRRELKGRIGVDAKVLSTLGDNTHSYTDYDVHITMYACEIEDGQQPYPASVNDLRWVPSAQFVEYDFPPADEKTMTKLLGLIRN